MPVSAIQHRLSTECYVDKPCKNKRERVLESINSNPSVSIHDFSSHISHVENSPRIFSPSPASVFARKGALLNKHILCCIPDETAVLSKVRSCN